MRDLVNLVPAMQHRVASRVNAIRACLNAEAFAVLASTTALDKFLQPFLLVLSYLLG